MSAQVHDPSRHSSPEGQGCSLLDFELIALLLLLGSPILLQHFVVGIVVDLQDGRQCGEAGMTARGACSHAEATAGTLTARPTCVLPVHVGARNVFVGLGLV